MRSVCRAGLPPPRDQAVFVSAPGRSVVERPFSLVREEQGAGSAATVVSTIC